MTTFLLCNLLNKNVLTSVRLFCTHTMYMRACKSYYVPYRIVALLLPVGARRVVLVIKKCTEWKLQDSRWVMFLRKIVAARKQDVFLSK